MNKIMTVAVLAMVLSITGCLTWWSYTPEEQKAFDAGVTVAADWYDYTTPIPVEQDIKDMNDVVVPACWGKFRDVTNGVYSPMIPKIVDSIQFRVNRPEVCNKGVLNIVTELDKLFVANPTWKQSAKHQYMTYLNGVQSGLNMNSTRIKSKNAVSPPNGTNTIQK